MMTTAAANTGTDPTMTAVRPVVATAAVRLPWSQPPVRRCGAGRTLTLMTTLILPVALAACQSIAPGRADVGAIPPRFSTVATIRQASGQCPDSAAPAGSSGPYVAGFWRRQPVWQQTLADNLSAAQATVDWTVDFAAGESVVRIDAGAQPNPGYRLVVGAARSAPADDTLRLPATVQPPAGGLMQPQVVGWPCVWLWLGPSEYRQVEVLTR